jgi:hypothetical protein
MSTSSAWAERPILVPFVLDDLVPPAFKGAVVQDWAMFASLFSDSGVNSPELSRLMGFNQSSGSYSAWSDWMRDRVHYLVPSEFPPVRRIVIGKDFAEEDLGIRSGNYLVPMPGTPALNIGLLDYLLVLRFGVHRSYKFVVGGELKIVPILSPRVGVVMLLPDFLNSEIYRGFSVDVSESARSLVRVSTLFHEGRHSDGHGASLGFKHSVCPQGHDFAEIAACDPSSNGGYAVKAAVLQFALQACDEKSSLADSDFCHPVSREFLRLVQADSLLRIQVPLDSESWDATPELDLPN